MIRPALLAAAVVVSGCALHPLPITSAPRPVPADPDVWVFCGPDPQQPGWEAQLAALAVLGVDAVHGPCRTPGDGYTVLHTATRYAPPSDYLTLAAEASALGLGVVAYDPRLWGTDLERAAATVEWAPFVADGTLVAVDLGDEPVYADMVELDRRAGLVRSSVGVEPTTIFVGDGLWGQSLAGSHARLPLACPGTDRYGENADAIDDALTLRGLAGCARIVIDTTGRDLDADGDVWSVGQIARALDHDLPITLFAGVQPANYPAWAALVDDDGALTEAGRAIEGALG